MERAVVVRFYLLLQKRMAGRTSFQICQRVIEYGALKLLPLKKVLCHVSGKVAHRNWTLILGYRGHTTVVFAMKPFKNSGSPSSVKKSRVLMYRKHIPIPSSKLCHSTAIFSVQMRVRKTASQPSDVPNLLMLWFRIQKCPGIKNSFHRVLEIQDAWKYLTCKIPLLYDQSACI